MTPRTMTTTTITPNRIFTAAIATLMALLGLLPACGDLDRNSIPVDSVAYRPDGSLVVFMPTGISIYDGGLKTELAHIPIDVLGFRNSLGSFWYNLSADGTTAAVTFSESTSQPTPRVALFRIPDGELLSSFELAGSMSSSFSRRVFLSPDGYLLAAFDFTDRSKLAMVDASTGAVLWESIGWPNPGIPPAWSPDGATIYTESLDIAPATERTLDALDARTGAVKWRTKLADSDLLGLSIVNDGALLAAAAYVVDAPRMAAGDAPPTYPFWSTADGTLTTELPAVPNTWLYSALLDLSNVFTCAADSCAVGLRDYTHPDQSQPKSVRVFQPDGTVRQTLNTESLGATSSVAISPDGALVAAAAQAGLGGVTVFSIADGSVVARRNFPIETF